MPISNKILRQIEELNESDDFKKLLINLLVIEDTGSKVNINFAGAVDEYIEKSSKDEESL